ncbi:GL10343 [Drosophila persimilis]|uniref:GL10343 n=1 Tax=Drosophila persimilis TaxID=7234 RepID=B4H9L5_DROPE|nr:GL10343 [Drosophila persimilis]
MSQNNNSFIPILAVLFLAFLVGQTVSECNVCQSNKVACINSTSFYLCFGDGTPHTDQLYHCLEGFDCTNLTAICTQKSNQRPPSCGDTSQCGQCSAHRNFLFACLSRGIFQMCYGAVSPTGKFGYCPTGMVCDASTDSICVPEVANQTLTCDLNDQLVDTTTASPTSSTSPDPNESTESTPTVPTIPTVPTTTMKPLTPLEVCTQHLETGLYPTDPPDTSCKRYESSM